MKFLLKRKMKAGEPSAGLPAAPIMHDDAASILSSIDLEPSSVRLVAAPLAGGETGNVLAADAAAFSESVSWSAMNTTMMRTITDGLRKL